jgi:hypothetical protein
MEIAAVHLHLDEIASGALFVDGRGRGRRLAGETAGLVEAEGHAAAGCSRCARALVNARETAVDLAISASSPASDAAGGDAAARGPSAGLRERTLLAARSKARRAPRWGGAPRRFFDPSAETARLHRGAATDDARVQEIDDLAADIPGPGDACERYLAQLERIISFPLLFVSIVRGERVGYRVQRGLDVAFGDMRDRRRETTFCTHTVSGDAPMLVSNAGEEPFFRGSTMVQRIGVKAYAGVPLRTSRDVVIGTLCAMDFRPRAIGADVVRALELFTEPVLAEIERLRRMPAERVARTAAGTPIHRAAWFRSLLGVELSVANAAGRPSTLVVARGASAELLADIGREDEPAGRLGPDSVGLLLPGADDRGAENRCAELGDALASRGRQLHLVREPGHHGRHRNADEWCDAALGPRA